MTKRASLSLLSAVTLSACAALPVTGKTPKNIQLDPIGTYYTGIFAESAAEIVAHDPSTQRLFVVNALSAKVDVISIANPAAPALVGTIGIGTLGKAVQSVAFKDGLIAIAIEAFVKTDPGSVAFYDAGLNFLSSVTVGALPDMVTFSPDGLYALVANEGEPSDSYAVDPEGSISIIDLSAGAAGLTDAQVRTADFKAFNNASLDPSVRVFGPGATVAQDLEPEYITVSHDSKTAWVTLQEANAIAVVDVRSATVTAIEGLGLKDHSIAANALDAGDRDGAIIIKPWPVSGFYMPDAISNYRVRGETYLVLANEGDARAYTGFNEEGRVKEVALDATAFPDGANLKKDSQIGRLRITKANGDTDGDGDYDKLFTYGARSFSIRGTDGSLIFDSGSAFERIIAELAPKNFNANHEDNTFDGRSDDKGPEPEGLAVGKVFGRTYAFVGLERISGVMVYDISEPASARFVEYVNFRDFGANTRTKEAGDLGPEGLIVIDESDSPNGQPLLVVANEVSGTTTIYQISQRE